MFFNGFLITKIHAKTKNLLQTIRKSTLKVVARVMYNVTNGQVPFTEINCSQPKEN